MVPAGFHDALAGALRRDFPGFLALLEVSRLSGGASQETYRLDIETTQGRCFLAFRRTPGGAAPSGEVEQIGPRAEAQVIRAARAAGVPVAEIVAELRPGDGLGEGFIMRWLDGETLGSRIARSPALAAVRGGLARECGRILARIHGIDWQAQGLDRALKLIPPEALVRQTWRHYQSFGSPQPMIDYTAQWLLANLPTPGAPKVTHADFRNGNLMVSPAGVVGVLDWEIAHLGDPMRDLGWLCTASWRFGGEPPVGGFGEYADLFAGYAEVSGTPVDPSHVWFWQVFGSFWWAVGCLAMADHWRHGPDRTVERPAIGRRSSECQVDCLNLLIPGPVAALEGATLEHDELPGVSELLLSVEEFLRLDAVPPDPDRRRFLNRVAANSLALVRRELATGEPARRAERERLAALLGMDDTLVVLRWQLVHALREGRCALDDPALIEHLRQTVVNQALIDQPNYPGCRLALAGGR